MAKPKRVPLNQAEDQSLQCRDFGHGWTHSTDFGARKDKEGRLSYVARILVCIRCGTMRNDEYELPSFQRIKSTYIYPENYLIPGHKGHIPVATVRAEIFRRMKKGGAK